MSGLARAKCEEMKMVKTAQQAAIDLLERLYIATTITDKIVS